MIYAHNAILKAYPNQIKEITNARINEILNYIFNKNKNLNYINDKILRLHLYFEDKDVLENLGEVFINSLNVSFFWEFLPQKSI